MTIDRTYSGRSRDVGSHTITLRPIGDIVVCRPDEPVLSAILRSGAKIVFGCRGGGCGTCKMRLISGTVEHGRCSGAVLPEEEKENGSFLSCQARALAISRSSSPQRTSIVGRQRRGGG